MRRKTENEHFDPVVEPFDEPARLPLEEVVRDLVSLPLAPPPVRRCRVLDSERKGTILP